jgi:hypothetical protein
LAHDHDRALPRPARCEALTVLLLSAGSLLLPVIGWVAGAVLLWRSPAWTRRDRIIGSLPPLGFGLGVLSWYDTTMCVQTTTLAGEAASPMSCERLTLGGNLKLALNAPGRSYLPLIALIVVPLLLGIAWPLATTIYLTVRLWRLRWTDPSASAHDPEQRLAEADVHPA